MGGVPAGPLRSEWKPLLLAAIASVIAHAVLLVAARVPRDEEAAAPRFLVRLAAAPATASGAAAIAPPAPLQPAPVAAVAPEPARPASAAAPAARKPAPARPANPRVFHTEETWSLPPRARSAPRTGDTGAALKARRLPVTVWIDAAGRVRRAEVTRNEVSEELAQALEAGVMGVRFVPARRDGEGVGAEYRTLLCFDDAGRLDTVSPECWQVEDTTPR